jgi:predicted amidohydrolase
MIIACGQMEATTIDGAADVWPAVDRLAALARRARADLLVLPETTYPAYWLDSRERYLRDDVERSAAVLERFGRFAAQGGFWVVAGFVEEADGRIYNAAAVFDRSGGLVGVARKHFLWDCDHRWFSAGDEIRGFDTEFGRMGVLICADARVPEIVATLAADGAEFAVEPTAWVNTSGVRRVYRNIQPDFLIRCRAREFGIPFACASKAGREGSVLEYVGQSQIVDAGGNDLARAPEGGEHLVLAEVAPCQPVTRPISAEHRGRILSEQTPFVAGARSTPCSVSTSAGAAAVHASIRAAGGRTLMMESGELESFAPLRCAALDGVQAAIVRSRSPREDLLRARAAENRIFLLVVDDAMIMAVNPNGAIIRRRSDGREFVEIDLSEADVKQFTPETRIWGQRRPSCYRLSPAAEPAARRR